MAADASDARGWEETVSRTLAGTISRGGKRRPDHLSGPPLSASGPVAGRGRTAAPTLAADRVGPRESSRNEGSAGCCAGHRQQLFDGSSDRSTPARPSLVAPAADRRGSEQSARPQTRG